MFLVCSGDERTSHFQPVFHVVDEFVAEGEEFGVVNAGDAAAGHDGIGAAHAVGTGNALFCRIPHDKVVIILVVFIRIASGAGTFAHGAEGDFALYADFMQQSGNAAPLCGVDLQAGALVGVEQVLFGREGIDFRLELIRRNRRCDWGKRAWHSGVVRCRCVRIPQHHAAEPQIVRKRSIARQQLKSATRHWLAYPHLVQCAAVAFDFTRQER